MTPTLTFSTKNLSPTFNGKVSLNPVLKPITTSLVAVVNPIVAIPIPLVLLIGKILGVIAFKFSLFLIISTWSSPNLYFISIPSTLFLVLPSKTSKVGALIYPRPAEEIPTVSNLARASKNNTWGKFVEGLNVGSDGKSNPISLTLLFLILPIEVLNGLIIAPVPVNEAIEVIPGKE